MLIERRAVAHSEQWDRISAGFFISGRSSEPRGPLHVLESGRESLSITPDSACLKRLILELVHKLLFEHASASTVDVSLRGNLFPAIVDIAGYRQKVEKTSSAENRAKDRLADRLRAAFEADPLEDGMTHRAGEVIRETLQSTDGHRALEWLKSFSLDSAHPGLAASVLRCLGRQEWPATAAWRAEVVRAALAVGDVEMRDAAAQAAESWGDPDMREVLMAHAEPQPWLRDYIRDIVEDLGA